MYTHRCSPTPPCRGGVRGGGNPDGTRAGNSMKKRVGILISGRGSNMMALVEAARAADYPAEIALVISNRPDAPGLARARRAGPPGARHRPQGLRDPRGVRRRRRRGAGRAGRRPRLPRRLHAHPAAGFRPPAGSGASSTSTPRCCRCSRACIRTSRRSTRACASRAARCISSPPELDAGPIVAQAAVAGAWRATRPSSAR